MKKQGTKKSILRRGLSGRTPSIILLVGLVVFSLSILTGQFLIGQKSSAIVNEKIQKSRLGFSTTAFDGISSSLENNSRTNIEDGRTVQVVQNKIKSQATNCSYGENDECNIEAKQKEFPRICVDSPFEEPRWEWHNFSQAESKPSSPSLSSRKKRLLIAQYSAFGKYARLLELTSPINKEYARRWNFDIVILQGTTMIMPYTYDKNCTPTEERSMFNKVEILLMALSNTDYDQLLILDADTLICDFSFDITTLMPENSMLVAQRLRKEDPPTTSNINNGVTLWNLRNLQTEAVARDWNTLSRHGILDNRPYRGDQYFLRLALQKNHRESSISAVWDEFYYREGTVVKHIQRPDPGSWNLQEGREERISSAVEEVCSRFGIDAGNLEYVNYTIIKPEPLDFNLFDQRQPTCTRDKATWRVYHNRPNRTVSGRKRLLIAQYSGNDSYLSLLNLTAPVNLAYAREWEHDMLLLKGTTMVLEADDPCNIPPERARFNKIPLLARALSDAQKYDQVLILDTDAMIVNFDFDVTKLLNDTDFLAAHRVDRNDGRHTWNINNGASLWALNHPTTKRIAAKWAKVTVEDMTKTIKRGGMEHGDQNSLQRVLLRDEDAVRQVNALSDEFGYENGTVVKHFVRQGIARSVWDRQALVDRKKNIKKAISDVCKHQPLVCDDEIPSL